MTGSIIRYDAITILLHWVTALLVVTLFGLAEFWGFLPRGTPLRHELQGLHISLGLVLAVVATLRVVWRLMFGRTLPEIESTLPYWAAKGVHYLLYILLGGQVVLGFVFRWAQGEAFTFFGLFAVPSAFAPDKALAQTIGEAHELVGWAIILLAGLHAAAALFHHYALRDSTLKRMLPY
ncbi:MAG: cytochrome b [Novosphingobium aromaticivorans]|jgi:cytochrome b561|nr:cytochrome b [Novosphingobium aromaticivorans]